MKWDATLTLPFAAGDVGSTQTTGALDLDTIGAERHGHLNGLLHGAAETESALQVRRNIPSDQLGLDLGLLNFLNVEEDLLTSELSELFLDLVDFLALAANNDSGTGGEDLDANAIGGALDEDTRHRSLLELLHELRADELVFSEKETKLLLTREPAGLPVAADGTTATCRIGFLTHGNYLVLASDRTMRMCDIFLRRGMAVPRAPALKRLRTGPFSTRALRTMRLSAETLLLFSAFATADFRVLAMRRADLRGMSVRSSVASMTGRPWISRATSRTFLGDMRA